jgi:hypothetical protein
MSEWTTVMIHNICVVIAITILVYVTQNPWPLLLIAGMATYQSPEVGVAEAESEAYESYLGLCKLRGVDPKPPTTRERK